MVGQPIEEWRVIPESPDYCVSSFGRVRRANMGRGVKHYGQCRKLLPGLIQPYLNVRLPMNGKWKTVKVHQLVAVAFLGQCPANRQINHKSGVRADNRAENLEYVTASENTRHAHRMGLTHPARGERCGRAKLTSADVARIRQLGGTMYQREIGQLFGIEQTTVSCILRRKSWRHE